MDCYGVASHGSAFAVLNSTAVGKVCDVHSLYDLLLAFTVIVELTRWADDSSEAVTSE